MTRTPPPRTPPPAEIARLFAAIVAVIALAGVWAWFNVDGREVRPAQVTLPWMAPEGDEK